MALKWRTRGQFFIAPRDTEGNPQAFDDAGCADLGTASIGLTVEQGEHIESCSGQDLVDFTFDKAKKGSFAIGLTEFTPANLLMALNGTAAAAAGAPVVVAAEDGPLAMLAGQYAQLGGLDPHQNITGLVVTDIGSPGGVLTVTTDYTLDAVTGLVKFLVDTDGQVTFAYSHTDMKSIAMLTQGSLERWVKFTGKNVAQGGLDEIVDLYRVRFPPTTAFDLLPNDLGVLTLNGTIIADTNKPVGGALGQFGIIHRGVA